MRMLGFLICEVRALGALQGLEVLAWAGFQLPWGHSHGDPGSGVGCSREKRGEHALGPATGRLMGWMPSRSCGEVGEELPVGRGLQSSRGLDRAATRPCEGCAAG